MDTREDFLELDDPTVVCASCDQQMPLADAAELERKHYHPDCAGVWKCDICGCFAENGKKCPGCGAEEKP